MLSNGALVLLFISFSWTFNNGPLPSNAIVFDISPMSSLLVLNAIDSTNDGAFTCTASETATGIVSEDTAVISVSGIYTRIISLN